LPRDYYEILGVDRDSDEKELKRAYRKAALKFHPDRNQGDPEAEAKFKEAGEAYEVLRDGQKRAIYDKYGHDGLRSRGFETGFGDIGDIFSAFGDVFGFGDIFGGGRGRGGRRAHRRPGEHLEYRLKLDFMDAVHGVTEKIDVPRAVHCRACDGHGLKPGRTPGICSTCGGMGQVEQAQGFLRLRTVCPSCRGQGKKINPEDRCDTCGGAGKVRQSEEITVKIPAGCYSGLQIRHPGKGEAGDPGAPAGDLYVTLDVRPHEYFKRDGANTYVSVPVPYPVMVLGGEITVPTVHGEETLEVARGTASGTVIVQRGKGIAHIRGGMLGDNHVRLVVDVPQNPSDEVEDAVRGLAGLLEVGVQEKGFWKELFGKLTS
jgi:molecular chaperone DnaJ